MNQQHGRGVPSRPIPKRPLQRSEAPPSPPKRSSLMPLPPPSEQPSSLPKPASILSDEVDNVSLLAEIATVKSEALRPKAPLDRKNGVSTYAALVHRTASRLNLHSEEQGTAIPYPALIRGRRSRKRRFFAWAIPFLNDGDAGNTTTSPT